MKKYFGFVLILVSLSGCDLGGYLLKLQAEQEAKEFENKVKEIEKAKDPYLAYKIFEENCLYHYFRRSDDNGDYVVYLCSDELIKKAGKEEVCQKPYEKLVDSDECILWRRENNGKVTFSQTTETNFDYKRFLPDDTWIQTDADFIWFIENANLCNAHMMQNGYQSSFIEDENMYKKKCPLSSSFITKDELTSKEKEQRDKNINQAIPQDIRNLAMSSKERLKEEKEEKQKQKVEEEKEKAYNSCIEKLDKKINRCGDSYKIGCRTGVYAEVVSIVSNGVLVGNPYNGKMSFIYTNKSYTTGTWVSNEKNVYYEYVGTYDYISVTGNRQRVHAFKEVNLSLPNCDDYKK